MLGPSISAARYIGSGNTDGLMLRNFVGLLVAGYHCYSGDLGTELERQCFE